MAAKDRSKPVESKKKEVEEEVIEYERPVTPVLQWTLLTLEQISFLRDLTVDEVQLRFQDFLQLKKQSTCVKEAVVLDYFVSGFWWTKEMNFSNEQTSFVMALLQSSIDNIIEKQMPFVDNFTEFGKTLIDLRRTPSADGYPPLFDTEQAKAITDYFTCSLFQHYSMYEFLFSQSRDKKLLGMERSVEVIGTAEFFAPLEEGMAVDVYQRYLACAQVESPEEVSAGAEAQAQAGKEAGIADWVQGGSGCWWEGVVVARREEEEEEEETGGAEEQEGGGGHGDEEEKANKEEEDEEEYSVEEVQEALGEMAKEMMGNLQAEFTEKLRIQEETYTARIDRLKSASSK
ncbi:hypothetical protein ACEWY4_026097 [Coilia grayii]|uniref:Ciliary-associated calcium-binding coiled-coil protein 1 n=1 Tax=Coilia grayii TaxID=363190 RepID=A0ABD1ITV1_9TELE